MPAKLPPGPRSRLRCTLRMVKEPIASAREWHASYGDTFHVPLVGGDFVMTCDPELVRQVLDEQVEWGRGKLILEPLGGIRMRWRPRRANSPALAS